MAATLKQIQQKQNQLYDNRFTYDKAIWETFEDSMKVLMDHHKNQQKIIKQSLPLFWYFAVMNSGWIQTLNPSKVDKKVLRYLNDITIDNFHSSVITHPLIPLQKTLRVGYSITFTFDPNPYTNKNSFSKSIEYNLRDDLERDIVVNNSGFEGTDEFWDELGDRDTMFDFFEIFDEEDLDDVAALDLGVCEKISKETLPFAFDYFQVINSFNDNVEEEEDEEDYDDYYDDDGDYYDDDDDDY
ncbi:Nucleosome assembly protein [Entamoeba marina]